MDFFETYGIFKSFFFYLRVPLFLDPKFVQTFHAFSQNESKIHEGEYVKDFFRKLAGWHFAASLRINFFTDNFQGF